MDRIIEVQKRAYRISLLIVLAGFVMQAAADATEGFPCNQTKTETTGAAQREVRRLEVGKPIERELKGGESHTYEIALEAGQLLNAVVEQRGIDVVVQWIGPDGKQLMEVDSPNGTQGDEPVTLITEAAGVYRLNVRSLEKDVPAGKYGIRVKELRAATGEIRALIEQNRVKQEATKLNQEVERLINAGEYGAALPLAERALTIRERALGAEHPDTAESLNNLAVLYYSKGDYAKAEPLYVHALTINEKALGAEHPSTAESLNNLAALYYSKGDYPRAEPLYRRALVIREKALGAEHSSTAESLNNLAGLYYSKGDYPRAEPLYRRALVIREKRVGAEHPLTANSLNNLALLFQAKGDYGEAEPLFIRALAIREKVLGAEHPKTSESLNNLAGLYYSKGEYVKAEPLYLRALVIYEKTLGPQHSYVANSLNNLALVYVNSGAYAKAEPLLERALAISEKVLGPQHPYFASSLNALAMIYQAKGDYAKAEPLYQRVLAIREKALGPENPDVAQPLNNLAVLYKNKGDYAKAEPLLVRALAINEKALGPEHPYVAYLLNNLAGVYHNERDYAKAEPLYQRALAIREKALGPEHPEVAHSLNNLGELYRTQHDYVKAEMLFQRALAIYEKTLEAGHPDVGTSLNDLGALYTQEGDYAKAEPLFQRALLVFENSLGLQHPNVANSLNNLSTYYQAQGDIPQAIAFLSRTSDVRERDFLRNLVSGSERQKLIYISQSSNEEDTVISLHVNLAPNRTEALRLAAETLLRRKGRGLDAMTDAIAAIRRRASTEDQKLLDLLASARSQLANLTLRGPGREGIDRHRANLRVLDEQVDKFESETSNRSAEFRVQQNPITLDNVQRLIPSNAVLVEFVSYRPFNLTNPKGGTHYGKSRYVAYVFHSQGEPTWAELGDAEVINSKIEAFRKALRDKRRNDVNRLARSLDRDVMQPVRKLIGSTHHVFLSPDGALNLIPFAALVDEHDRYLVERYLFTYLTTGRDLLRFKEKNQSRQGAMVIADPDFGEVNKGTDIATASTSSEGVLSDFYFTNLEQTEQEAKELKVLFPQAEVLTRTKATEAALKRTSGPQILHIATHGFFLDQSAQLQEELKGEKTRLVVRRRKGESRKSGTGEAELINPLMRSGLALAGANTRSGGEGNDGILTALEATGLDLWGTKLVVLSACDTGVGEVKNGDGVFGLRRALVLAGSESQMMSLWPVSDRGTRDLMIDYYKALKAGQGRSEALRQVQLRMLKDPRRRHPFYWASFIQSGEWANLDGKRVD